MGQHVLILQLTDSVVLGLFNLMKSNFEWQREWFRMVLGRNFLMKILFIMEENKMLCLGTLTCTIPKDFIKIIYLPIKGYCRFYEEIYLKASRHHSTSESKIMRKWQSVSQFWRWALHGAQIQIYLSLVFDGSNHIRLIRDKHKYALFPVLPASEEAQPYLVFPRLRPLVLLNPYPTAFPYGNALG